MVQYTMSVFIIINDTFVFWMFNTVACCCLECDDVSGKNYQCSRDRALKMEAVGSFNILVNFCYTIWHHIPDNSILRGHYYENRESHVLVHIYLSSVQ
jgi:hypothetical protein